MFFEKKRKELLQINRCVKVCPSSVLTEAEIDPCILDLGARHNLFAEIGWHNCSPVYIITDISWIVCERAVIKSSNPSYLLKRERLLLLPVLY
jgi:hypothetical protein